ncbi:MAG: N-acetyltransferase [Pseudomonadota bacterium]
MSDPISKPTASSATPSDLLIEQLRESDDDEIALLHAEVFGPGRFARTAFRLRETAPLLREHCFCARLDDGLVGAVSISKISVGDTRLALLGPLAVKTAYRDAGIGRALLARATQSVFDAAMPGVLLVGDAPYYAAAGYQPVRPGSIQMPGPVDPMRLLLARNPSMGPGAIEGRAEGCSD